MQIDIRPHRPEEEPRLAELMLALDAEGAGIRPTNAENVARTFIYLRAGAAHGLCAVALKRDGAEERIVGYLLSFPFWSAEYGGLLSLIDEIYVTPELRSQGIGTRLMEFVEAHARSAGHVALSLLAMERKPRSHDFYERLGFDEIEARSFDKLLVE
jgi:GNAT superfamily N-acetyltransferase